MKFFILCSFIWMSFSTMAVTLHHSEIPQEDQQYLNQDITILDDLLTDNAYENRIHYGCNSRDEYIGRCVEYCRPPNSQDQQVTVVCSYPYEAKIESARGEWQIIYATTVIGVGTSPEEAEEDAKQVLNSLSRTRQPLTVKEFAKMTRESYRFPLRIGWIRKKEVSCTPRVCVGVDYSLR